MSESLKIDERCHACGKETPGSLWGFCSQECLFKLCPQPDPLAVVRRLEAAEQLAAACEAARIEIKAQDERYVIDGQPPCMSGLQMHLTAALAAYREAQ